jgi:hypothetical protein
MGEKKEKKNLTVDSKSKKRSKDIPVTGHGGL